MFEGCLLSQTSLDSPLSVSPKLSSMIEQWSVSLGTNFSQQIIEVHDMEIINQPRASAYLWANIPIVLFTLIINCCAVVVIGKKEQNGINKLIVGDCVVNVVVILVMTFNQSPWFIMKSSPPCLMNTSILLIITMWNRLVPVGIAVFRYIMVCHPVYTTNHGGDKGIMKMVTLAIIILSLLGGIIGGATADKCLTFLRCIGREETFR